MPVLKQLVYVHKVRIISVTEGLDSEQQGWGLMAFVAGYGDADDLPQDLKAAMLLLVGHDYGNREATDAVSLKKRPMAVESILRQYEWRSYAWCLFALGTG